MIHQLSVSSGVLFLHEQCHSMTNPTVVSSRPLQHKGSNTGEGLSFSLIVVLNDGNLANKLKTYYAAIQYYNRALKNKRNPCTEFI